MRDDRLKSRVARAGGWAVAQAGGRTDRTRHVTDPTRVYRVSRRKAMNTGAPTGGDATRRRQRGAVRPGVSTAQPSELTGLGNTVSDPVSPFEAWGLATMRCSVSQKLAQGACDGWESSAPRASGVT